MHLPKFTNFDIYTPNTFENEYAGAITPFRTSVFAGCVCWKSFILDVTCTCGYSRKLLKEIKADNVLV